MDDDSVARLDLKLALPDHMAEISFPWQVPLPFSSELAAVHPNCSSLCLIS